MDTIPPTHRIALRVVGTQPALRRSNATEAKNLLVQIHNLLRLYNARTSLLPLHERQALDLTAVHFAQRLDGTAVLIHHDSPAWCVSTMPAARRPAPRIGTSHYVRPFHPTSRAELRAYFLRKGGDVREAWRRFPPSSSEEQAEYERATAGKRPTRLDPFEIAVRKAARKAGKLPTDPAIRAQVRAEIDALDALLGDLL